MQLASRDTKLAVASAIQRCRRGGIGLSTLREHVPPARSRFIHSRAKTLSLLQVQVPRTRAAEETEDAVRGAVARDAQTARGCAKLRPAC